MPLVIHHRVDFTEMPWRNGAGTTLEVGRSPATATMDDFTWRMSFAHVGAGGPFSAFPGVDRVILLVRGGRMVLDMEGPDGRERHDLGRFEPLAFPGELPVTSDVTEPSMDFNLMTRRERCTGTVTVDHVDRQGSPVEPVAGSLAFLVVLDGEGLLVTDDERQPLTALDVVEVDARGTVTFAGSQPLVVARMTITPRSRD